MDGGALVGQRGLRHIEPGIEPLGALLHIADGMEIFVELGAILGAESGAQRGGFVQHGVEHAAALVQRRALGRRAARWPLNRGRGSPVVAGRQSRFDRIGQ